MQAAAADPTARQNVDQRTDQPRGPLHRADQRGTAEADMLKSLPDGATANRSQFIPARACTWPAPADRQTGSRRRGKAGQRSNGKTVGLGKQGKSHPRPAQE